MTQTVLIVGANKGIGLELAKQYYQGGDYVIALCRKASSDLIALSKAHTFTCIENIDVSDDNALQDLPKKVEDALAAFPTSTTQKNDTKAHIDVFIHNAGILVGDSFPNIDSENMRKHFEINTLAPLNTVLTLRHLFTEGSKVGIMSSRVGSVADNTSSNNYAYRVSKSAVNMVGKCLSIDLAEEGVAVALLHPGYVRTEMTRHNGLIDAKESAQGLIQRMNELSMETTGIFVHTSGEVLTW